MQKYIIICTLQKKGLYNFPNLKKRVTFAFGFADMAQLVEQRIRNAWVRGSSPLFGSQNICKYTQKNRHYHNDSVDFLFVFLRPTFRTIQDETIMRLLT